MIHVLVLAKDQQIDFTQAASLEVVKSLARNEVGQTKFHLLDSAVFSAQSPYVNNLWQRGARFLRSLTKNHIFFDGNKRTALICIDLFFLLNGYYLSSTQTQKVRFIRSVAFGKSLWKIESWLRRHSRKSKTISEPQELAERIVLVATALTEATNVAGRLPEHWFEQET